MFLCYYFNNITLKKYLYKTWIILVGENNVKKIMIFIVFVLMLSLVACSDGDPYDSVVSGDFIYTKWSMTEGEIAIIELSDEGKQKETLIFPFMLDGLKVTHIGSKFGLKDSGILEIDNARNIYFTYNTPFVKTGIEYANGSNTVTINVYVGDVNAAFDLFAWEHQLNNSSIFMTQSLILDLESRGFGRENYIPANIEYYIDEDTLYFVDNAEGTLVNVVPPTPFKDGYEFVGWFKDTDFNQPFVFDEDVIPIKQFDNENLLINITKIYAKWQ
jgi:hypothetical protein